MELNDNLAEIARPILSENVAAAAQQPAAVSPTRMTAVSNLRLSPALMSGLLGSRLTAVNLNPSLPLAESQNGSIFSDRDDTTLRWYLPSYALSDDLDTQFGFAATENGIDSSGLQFNTAQLSFSLKKVVPADVQAAQAQSPNLKFQEISWTGESGTLSLSFKDENGIDQQTTIAAQIELQSDGSIIVNIPSFTGRMVIVVYQNLVLTGGAGLSISFSYDVLRSTSPVHPVPIVRPIPVQERMMTPVAPVLQPNHPNFTLFRRTSFNPALLGLQTTPTPVSDPPPAPTYVNATAQSTVALPIAMKYSSGPYRAKYTLTASGVTQPILDVQDLTQFSVARSQYIEFTGVGDVASKYPSFSQLFLGQVNRTIVAVPASYGIVRGSTGCAALCQALVNPSAQSANGSKFHFTFTVAPVFDPIDLARLSHDLAGISSVSDCVLTLPTGLDARVPVAIASPFIGIPIAAAGTTNSYLLSFDITDSPDGTMPAAASVNLFLKQLAGAGDTPIFGHFGIHLDDDYSPPLQANVVLNLHTTSGSDDITVSMIDAEDAQISATKFDVDVSEYATFGPGGLAATPLQQTLSTSQPPLKVSVPAGTTGVLVNRTLHLPSFVTNAVIAQFINFETEDVQQVEYSLGINGTGVDYSGQHISQITIEISLASLPSLQIPALTLTPQHDIDSTQILIPISDAIVGLSATLNLTVQGGDPTKVAPQTVLTNDFAQNPNFVLVESMLAPAAPTT